MSKRSSSGVSCMEVASARKSWRPGTYLALASMVLFLVELSALSPVTGIPLSPRQITVFDSLGGTTRKAEMCSHFEEFSRKPRLMLKVRKTGKVLKIDDEPVAGVKNIFFVESSCALKRFPDPASYNSKSGLRLSPRAACALESAAAAHPSHRVYFVHTCYVRRRALEKGGAPAYALAALSAPNVWLWTAPYARHYVGTPLQGWLAKGALRRSLYPVVHASDILRFLLLWKYGGTYLDLDVLMLRSLEDEANFGCAENSDYVSVGAINFACNTTGRRFAEACIRELRDFRGGLWVHNGSGAITRAMKKVCRIKQVNEITKEKCGGFHLLPRSTFYSVPWPSWKLLFTEDGANETMKIIGNNSAVHVWNAKSHMATVYTSSKQPYAQIARRVCPLVVAVVGKTM